MRVRKFYVKGRGPGKNSLLYSFHIWVSFLKIYDISDYNEFQFLAWEQLPDSMTTLGQQRLIRLANVGVQRWANVSLFIGPPLALHVGPT